MKRDKPFLRLLRRLILWLVGFLDLARRVEVFHALMPRMIADVPVRDGQLLNFAATPLLFARARNILEKEPDTLAWIDSFKKDDVFWDIGANIGTFSLYAAGIRGIKTIAFEPSADNFFVLCRNVLLNNLGDRLVPYCVALAATTGTGVLNISSQELGAALHQFGAPGESSSWWSGQTTYAQGVVGYSIDDFVRNFNPPFPNHLKVDVDGLETSILVGAREFLRDPRLKSVMIELNLTDPKEEPACRAMLEEAGFDFVGLGQTFVVSGVTGTNHYFERRT